MQCLKCKFQNLTGMKFCGECGSRLERICPKCNFASPPDYKFCGECGHRFVQTPTDVTSQELSFDDKLDKIQRYLPKGLSEKILSRKNRIEGERKYVTVMFCDMSGFTALSENLGTEGVYKVMDHIYEILIHKVHDYDGTVNEFTGDGIMALFGAPIALEDAPQRAIRAAYTIHREITRFSDKLERNKEVIKPIKMRIGIHSGPVVVGTLGNDLRVEFKAVGDTVNLASRMEGLSEPGTIYVTEETFKLTEGFFRFEALGLKNIKGKTNPINVYRVIAPNSRKARFDVSAERGLSPFIGRERELELLLDGFKRVKEGKGQIFSIMAEAGMGKSRLLYEFRKAVGNEDVTFLEGKCLSYKLSLAYHPVIDVLKSNFEIQDKDNDFQIIEKIKTGLEKLEVDEVNTLPYLLDLLSVKDSGIDDISMSPEARKERIIEAVEQITLKGSQIRPLIIAIEDLHWIDKRSEEYFRHFSDRISGAKIFLIFTFRPAFVHSWGGRSYLSQITLNRLSNNESNKIASHLLKTKDIHTNLEKLILEKTEGIPFFIEEFIKSLKEMNLVKQNDDQYFLIKSNSDVIIPSTIQDIIMARVDSLPEEAKDVLQTGSIIEREFSYELIKNVTKLSENKLKTYLTMLRDAELIYERGLYPEGTYIFKHALTRAVVYDSILKEKKKKLHSEIGYAIENIYEESIHEYYGVLVNHFFESENYAKTAEYSKLAGNKAEASACFPEAIEYAKKRIDCLEKLPETTQTQKRIINARTKLGYYYIKLDYFAKAKEPIDPILEIAREYNYTNKLTEIISIVGIYQWAVEENFGSAVESLKKALEISSQANDIFLSRFPNYWLGVALSFMGEFESALDHFEKALDVAIQKETIWDISVVKSCIGYFVFTHQGNINLAHQYCEEALRLAEGTGDIFPKAFAYSNYGVICYFKGLFKKAIKNMSEGIRYCEKIKIYTWSAFTHFNLAELYFDIGEYDKSKKHYTKSISLMEKNRTMPSWVILNKICFAKARAKNNESIDLKSLLDLESRNNIELYRGLIQRSMGEIFFSIDEKPFINAEIWINEAIKTSGNKNMQWHLGKDYLTYAKILGVREDLSKSRQFFIKALEKFKQCGANGWEKLTEKEMTQV